VPKASEFKIATIQATIFTPGIKFVQSKIMGSVLQRWSDRFDAPPVSMPLPSDAPAEIPRIILTSSDKRYKFEMAFARANLFWLRQEDEEEINPLEIFNFATELLWEYSVLSSAKIGRMAGLLNRFVKEPTPGLFLAKHFCKETWHDAPFDRPERFEIHAHKRYALSNSFNVNSWVRCKTGVTNKPAPEPIILVEQDINTLSEEIEEREFTEEQLRGFFQILPEEFDSILTLYFPED